MPMPYTYRHASEEYRAFIADLRDRLGTPSDNVAYTCADAVFQVFRRRLTPEQALRFADALPCVLRAIFVANWDISAPPVPFASRAEMTREAQMVRQHHNLAPDSVIGDVAWALSRNAAPFDFNRALAHLSDEARAFWQVPADD